jgi:hypothetical protein
MRYNYSLVIYVSGVFVEDPITDGRTPEDIRAVANATHWKPRAEEAYKMARGLYRPRKRKKR